MPPGLRGPRPIAPARPMHPSVPTTMQPHSELAEMLSSLRLKEVLRDQSLSDMQTHYQEFTEMNTELIVQRAMLAADSPLLQAMERACSLRIVECCKTSIRYFELEDDYFREEKRVKDYRAEHRQPEPPRVKTSLKNVLPSQGDNFIFI